MSTVTTPPDRSNDLIDWVEASPEEAAEEITRLREELAAYQAAEANDPEAWPTITRLRSLVDECAEYMKEGETPIRCIKRNRADMLSTLNMLAKERKEAERLRSENEALKRKAEVARNLFRNCHKNNTALRARVERSIDDDELMRILRGLNPTEQQYRALTVTRWKDGIDVDFPSWLLKKLVCHFQDCPHEWVSADNEVVAGGEICTKCHAVRAKAPDEVGG